MRLSLYLKISLYLIISVVLEAAIVSVFVVNGSKGSLQKQIEGEQFQAAQQTLDKLDRFLYERRIDIQSFALHNQLSSLLTSKNIASGDVAIKDLETIKTYDAVWADISILDTNGNTIISTNSEDKKVGVLKEDPLITPFYQRALKGEVVSSDLMKVNDNESPLMFYMAPIRSSAQSSQVVGVVEAELAWPSALEILQSLHNYNAELINSSGLSIGGNDENSDAGIFITDFNKNKSFQKIKNTPDGTNTLANFDNQKDLAMISHVRETGFLEYKGNNWLLVLQTPTETASDPGERLATKLLVPFIIILMVSIAILIFVLNRMVLKPLKELNKFSNKLSEGDFSHRIKVVSQDEVGELSKAFNNMAEKLQFAYNNLKISSQEAQNERTMLETILNNLPVGVLVVEVPSGKAMLLNSAGKAIFGNQFEHIPYDNLRQVLYGYLKKEDGSSYPVDDLPLNVTIRTSKSSVKDDLFIHRPDGSTVAIRAFAAPIIQANGKINSAVVVFEDISKEKSLERSRDEFFSIASHELRTPLTAIKGNTSMIQEYYWDRIPVEDVKEMISDVHESSVRLIEIVNDFLDTSRLEQKRMKFEFKPMDLVDTAESVLKEYQVTGSRKKVHLEVNKPHASLPKVLADCNRTKQVLINLVGNALKFTNEGSVKISFELLSGYIKVNVTDTGMGIAPDAKKLLFKKFEQTGSSVLTRDSVRGTGLGLYISKMIIEQMKGSIWLESSELGQGTTFTFTLPIAKDPEQ